MDLIHTFNLELVFLVLSINRNFLTFEDNLKYKNNLLFVTCYNFGTATTPSLGLDIEIDEMFAVSCKMLLAFHPKLNQVRIIIEKRFGHML